MRSRRPLATRKLHASSVCDILIVIVASCAAGDRCFTSLVPCACFCLGTHAVHARASCEEPKSRRACLCSKNCQPLLHRSPTSLYCSDARKKNNSLALAMDVGTGGLSMTGYRVVARAMLAKDVLPLRGTAWRVCFAFCNRERSFGETFWFLEYRWGVCH